MCGIPPPNWPASSCPHGSRCLPHLHSWPNEASTSYKAIDSAKDGIQKNGPNWSSRVGWRALQSRVKCVAGQGTTCQTYPLQPITPPSVTTPYPTRAFARLFYPTSRSFHVHLSAGVVTIIVHVPTFCPVAFCCMYNTNSVLLPPTSLPHGPSPHVEAGQLSNLT
jgi:hypothetical protein